MGGGAGERGAGDGGRAGERGYARHVQEFCHMTLEHIFGPALSQNPETPGAVMDLFSFTRVDVTVCCGCRHRSERPSNFYGWVRARGSGARHCAAPSLVPCLSLYAPCTHTVMHSYIAVTDTVMHSPIIAADAVVHSPITARRRRCP